MGKMVLVVDDDSDIVTFVVAVLEENGYTSLIAQNGEVGMSKAIEEKPDLIILDILMPKESGIKMYSKLKGDELLKKIPVIILSGIARRTFLRSQEALTGPGNQSVPEPEAYLEKPVEPEELVEVIRKFI